MEVLTLKAEDSRYPQRLLKISKYPKMIYTLGDVSLLNKPYILAIVGSRECTQYGRKTATYFAKELAGEDIVIVSGFATGIDEAAHVGAIQEKRKNNSCFRSWF